MEARERGVLFDDDSPENTKAPVTNQSVARNVDLTRTQEIQSRYTLAQQVKNECWELVGMSKQRMGSISASESATGPQTAMQQSYAQTEPLFVAHEYVLGQLYQAIIDASLYIEANKPESTVSYITSEGESAFVQVNGTDLKFRDIKVFLTNRPEDTQMFNEIRQLSQAIIQNGGSLYDVIELYSTKSLREMKKTFKDLRDRQVQMQEQAQQLEQQKLEQQQQALQAQLQQAQQQHEEQIANENYNKELDRLNKKEVAIINQLGRNENATADIDNDGLADALEITKLSTEQDKVNKAHQAQLAKINHDSEKLAIEREKIKVERENMKNDEKIAKINASNRNKKDNKNK